MTKLTLPTLLILLATFMVGCGEDAEPVLHGDVNCTWIEHDYEQFVQDTSPTLTILTESSPGVPIYLDMTEPRTYEELDAILDENSPLCTPTQINACGRSAQNKILLSCVEVL